MNDVEHEIPALDAGGFLRRDDLALLRLGGEDRLRFLNGQITCQVATLTPGDGVYGYFVTLKGRVAADCVVLATDDAVLLALPAAARDDIAERLRKYVVVDRVEIEPLEQVATTLAGPTLDAVLQRLLGDDPPTVAWSHRAGHLAALDEPIRVVWHAERERPAGDRAAGSEAAADPLQLATLWHAPELSDALEDALADLGLEALDDDAWTALRVEVGLPLHGRDIGLDHFPHEVADEATLATAIDYTKGCYLGQEVVARIHYRGGVQRRLAGVRLEPARDTETDTAALDPATFEGAEVRFDGRVVGVLSSVAQTPHLGLVGLTVAHQRAADGAHVELVATGETKGNERGDETPTLRGELVALPFSLD